MNTKAIGLLALVMSLALASQGLAQTNDETDDNNNGAVLGLSIANVDALRVQDVVISNEKFIQFGGHFDIATLDWDETIGPNAGDNTMPSSGPNQVAWWDVVITVTRDPTNNEGVMISIDKDVTNNTDRRWTDFHMTIGRGVGAGFVESNELDFLYFKTDPPPLNEVPVTPVPNPVMAFGNPPMLDEPAAPDNLWWFEDPANGKFGLGPGQTTDFWLAISVPDSAFPAPGQGDPTMTTITLREHASVPEPASLLLAVLGALAIPILRRRNR